MASPPLPTALPAGLRPRRILVVRGDLIGDHVLAAGLLPLLRARHPQARILVVCPALVRDLFRNCPEVDGVLAFDKRRLHRNLLYRLALHVRIRAFGADLALNTVYSRDSSSDLLCGFSGARLRVAHRGDASNLRPARKQKNDRMYTHLVEDGAGDRNEGDRHRRFLAFLGVPGDPLPRVWLGEEDRTWASARLADLGLEGSSCLAVFPGASHPVRDYPRFGEALAAFLEQVPARIVILGSARDRAQGEDLLRDLPGRHANLCGETRLLQAGAILERCRLAFGSETGLAHMAMALGTPAVVLLGGGHAGRFMPLSPLASAVCHPLACFRCNWVCPYEKPHCIRDLAPEGLTRALLDAWEGPSDRARVYCQETGGEEGGPPPLRLEDQDWMAGARFLAVPPR